MHIRCEGLVQKAYCHYASIPLYEAVYSEVKRKKSFEKGNHAFNTYTLIKNGTKWTLTNTNFTTE